MSKLNLKPKLNNSIFYFLFFGTSVRAAELFFDAKTQEISMGQQFQADLMLDTKNEEINAIEGRMMFPADFLELKEIRDGNSIVNFWIEKPKQQNDAIIFSGITPGGFKGSEALIFSAVFEAKRGGIGYLEIKNARALRNDGNGSP